MSSVLKFQVSSPSSNSNRSTARSMTTCYISSNDVLDGKGSPAHRRQGKDLQNDEKRKNGKMKKIRKGYYRNWIILRIVILTKHGSQSCCCGCHLAHIHGLQAHTANPTEVFK